MKTDSINTANLNIQSNYDLFGSDNKENIHWGKLFIHLFGSHFSAYTVFHDFEVKALVKELKKTYKLPSSNIISNAVGDSKNLFCVEYECSEIFVIIKSGLCITITEHLLYIQYNSKIAIREVYKLLKIASVYEKEIEVPIKTFYMIKHDGDFSLLKFNANPTNVDIHAHYNDDFREIDKLITTSLESNKKNGLILLHGKYGTGKTYYLRHLINSIGRKFIYFPLNMIESLSSPSFLPFIAEHQNAVLILEDCESILVKRENGPGNSSALSNLLNIGDGLLADALNINVICTFNSGLKKIDDAILRKGRLIASYEFKELETVKAQQLSNSIGHKITLSNPMTVSEIYNLNSRDFESKNGNQIGFK
jgi:hypothetical protein